MHFGRTGCTADPWRCAALSYKLHFHLLLTEKTNNVTPMLPLQGQHTQRAASGSCPGSFHEYYWSGSVSLINRTKTIRWPKLT